MSTSPVAVPPSVTGATERVAAGGDVLPVLDAVDGPPPAPLPSVDVLRVLVADAAGRAAALLDDPWVGTAAVAADAVTVDVARFAALHGDAYLEAAAAHLGLTVPRTRQLAVAYRYGGPAAVATHLAPQPADPEVLAAAEHAVQPFRPAPTAPVERHHNHLTDAPARVQLRHGPDGLWHPYVERYGDWQPAAAPHADPAEAYRAARAALRGPGGPGKGARG
ncbi:hypothetical protein AB0F25_21930 [Streptomyces wedmorensis]|uniref:hypothetical protein n=1 Tax=Streptomyces wedmorensis TaxID=43759 RepID=UPI0034368B0C